MFPINPEMLNPEKSKLAKLGINWDSRPDIQVLCLPENSFTAKETAELRDTSDSSHLAKLLKEAGLNCVTAYDLGLDVPFMERRNADLWLGVVWVAVTTIISPVIVEVMKKLIAAKLDHKGERIAPTIRVELILENGPNVSRISYEGDDKTLVKLLTGLVDEQPR